MLWTTSRFFSAKVLHETVCVCTAVGPVVRGAVGESIVRMAFLCGSFEPVELWLY